METSPHTETACRHHWLLAQPEAGLVAGVCRKCNESRNFPAYLDEYDFGAAAGRPERSEELLARAVGGARPSHLTLLADPES
jgi:hypothetical protein